VTKLTQTRHHNIFISHSK